MGQVKGARESPSPVLFTSFTCLAFLPRALSLKRKCLLKGNTSHNQGSLMPLGGRSKEVGVATGSCVLV